MVQMRSREQMEAIIAAHIEPHPAKPGIERYRLKPEDGGYPVWAIIGSLDADRGNADVVAREFHLTADAMDAALAFYDRHHAVIDAWLLLNRGG